MRGIVILAAAAGAMLVSGCATGGGPGGMSASSEKCSSIKGQLNRLAAKGTPPPNKADADAYNKLLSEYLGGRCHEMKS